MRRVTLGMAVFVVMFFAAVLCTQAATLEDAKALSEKAAAFVKANGKDKAIAEFNNPTGPWVKGDLYVVLQDFNGVVLANGGNTSLVGQNHLGLKDPNGKYFVKESVEIAKKGSGWLDYNWVNPITKKVQPKKSWIKRVEGMDAFTNCGLFQ
jgi:signal transduction histidine kinase